MLTFKNRGFRCGGSDGFCSKALSSGQVVTANECGGGNLISITVSDNEQLVHAPAMYIVKAANSTSVPSPPGDSISTSPALQAAIGVSVSLGVILLSLLGFLAWRYKKRRTLARAKDQVEHDDDDGYEKGTINSQDALHEAHAESRRIEADGTERHVYELPGECLPELPEDAFQPMEVAGKEVEKKPTGTESTWQRRAAMIADLSNANINATLPSPTISSINDTPESTLDSTMVSAVSSGSRRFSF